MSATTMTSYTWAERRRIEAHPRTGAIQIVEVRERVEDFVIAPESARPTSVIEPVATENGTAVPGAIGRLSC